MTPIIEDSILGSDLDCRFYDLLNVKSLEPVPRTSLPSTTGLTDERMPLRKCHRRVGGHRRWDRSIKA
jgi:hypothetical protein